MVALAGLNEDQLLPMLDHCAKAGCDLTLIETMPLGEIADDRSDHYIPLHQFRSEEHTSELQSLMRISYAVFCLKKKNIMNCPKANYIHRNNEMCSQLLSKVKLCLKLMHQV